MIADIALALAQARPLFQRIFAFFLGALLAFFALAPMRWFFVFFIITPLMIWMLDGVKAHFKDGLILGFLFGFGYFFIGFYWVGYAFLISPVPQLALVAAIGLASLLSFFWALAFGLARVFWFGGLPLSLVFFWSLAEWARGFVGTGLPWNLPAQSWLFSLNLAQSFSWSGLYGATFLTLAFSVSFASLSRPKTYQALLPPFLAMGLLGLLWLWGDWRLSQRDLSPSGLDIIIIQPNIAQIDKWNPHKRRQIIEHYFSLSSTAINAMKRKSAKRRIMIWPEAALPIRLDYEPFYLKLFADLLPQNMSLILGLVRFDANRGFNSLYMINDKGEIKAIYDKNHLVPFGEYLPFQSFLEYLGVQQITGRSGGYSAGAHRPLLQLADDSYAEPLICYEISFPRDIAQSSNPAPNWLINITNDGWYGLSPGPHQHFDLARLRAIEFGLPAARAANTGISSLIDPYGDIIAKLGLNRTGVISAPLPKALSPTFYRAWRETPFFIFLGLCFLYMCFAFIFYNQKLKSID